MKNVVLLLIIAVALVSSGCSINKMIKAPKRSAKRIAAAADQSSELTDQEEYFIGRAVSAKIISTYPLLEDEKKTEYLNLVGNIISNNSNRPELIGGYHFAILNSPVINAFASPSGVVFVTTGLLDSLDNEDELAAVLAHEVAHINNKDGVSAIEVNRGEGLLTAIMLEPFRFAASLLPGHLAGFANVFMSSVDSVTDTVANKGYNIQQEFNADNSALVYLERSGYDPKSMLEYLKKLQESSINVDSENMSTHPGIGERIAMLEQVNYNISVENNIIEKRKERFDIALK